MPEIVLPYSKDFMPIPETIIIAGKERPVTFGVELEGFVDRIKLFELKWHQQTISGRFLSKQLRRDMLDNNKCKRTLADMIQSVGGELCALPHDENIVDRWLVGDDTSIRCKDQQTPSEIISPILTGNKGLERIDHIFSYLNSVPFKANESCGIHVHVSLGWDKNNIDVNTFKEVRRIHWAIRNNASFLEKLVEAYRLEARHSKNKTLAKSTGVPKGDQPTNKRTKITFARLNGIGVDPDDYMSCWCLYNFEALKEHGTIEFRGKEAAGYVDARGYIKFLVAFTCEAAVNPKIMVGEVLGKYFGGLTVEQAEKNVAPPSRNAPSVIPAPYVVSTQQYG
ncbi:MAG: amidoligase family protein [Alphaproteobacteria bacterium]|nr:amidoligase family protein [Alphaproteobacteria bacterium]